MMIAGLGGDPQAHESLLTALVPLLRSFFRRRIRDAEDDAEDLVQETLIAVHNRRASYDRNRPFTAWLYAIARYKLVDHFRRRRRLCPIEELSDILVTEGFEDATAAVTPAAPSPPATAARPPGRPNDSRGRSRAAGPVWHDGRLPHGSGRRRLFVKYGNNE